MNTCLSGLWDILLEKYYEKMMSNPDYADEDTCREEIGVMLERFYRDNSLRKPLHVQIFYDELSKNGGDVQHAAEQADKKSEECGLCVICSRCARSFYEILSQRRMERPLPTEWNKYFVDRNQMYFYLSAYKLLKSYRQIKDTLICLKGFSSTTPAIYSAVFEGACTGGGIYFNLDGFGVVIDPGIGFVESMHKQGIFIEDINAVIVTHNHLDHNADMGTVSALSYDINRYYRNQERFYQQFFPNRRSRKHEISWWLDESTQKANSEIVPMSRCLTECYEWKELNSAVAIKVIETKHMNGNKSYGIKCKLKLTDKVTIIGYTSDTRYFLELAEFMRECDILIFNISDIYEKDVRGKKQKNTHLGYDGSINLLQDDEQKFRLAIASEFCCNNGDYRMNVVRKLNEHVRHRRKAYVMPGEVGMKVDLQSGGIFCSRCKQVVSPESVCIVSPEREFGTIQYVCRSCRYKAED